MKKEAEDDASYFVIFDLKEYYKFKFNDVNLFELEV